MKKFIAMLMIGACAATAQASYLMWQVDSGDVGEFTSANAVRIAYSTDGKTADGYLTLQQVNDAGTGWDSLGSYTPFVGDTKSTPQLYANVDAYTGAGYSFFIELINYNSATDPVTIQTVAVSQVETYATLTEKGFTGGSLTPTTPAAVWHGGGFVAVPEPTSALLVMMGVGLLALKRKKA